MGACGAGFIEDACDGGFGFDEFVVGAFDGEAGAFFGFDNEEEGIEAPRDGEGGASVGERGEIEDDVIELAGFEIGDEVVEAFGGEVSDAAGLGGPVGEVEIFGGFGERVVGIEGIDQAEGGFTVEEGVSFWASGVHIDEEDLAVAGFGESGGDSGSDGGGAFATGEARDADEFGFMGKISELEGEDEAVADFFGERADEVSRGPRGGGVGGEGNWGGIGEILEAKFFDFFGGELGDGEHLGDT